MLLDDLEAGEEEEERQPDVREEHEVLVQRRDVEHLGADEDPEQHLEDHRRHDET